MIKNHFSRFTFLLFFSSTPLFSFSPVTETVDQLKKTTSDKQQLFKDLTSFYFIDRSEESDKIRGEVYYTMLGGNGLEKVQNNSPERVKELRDWALELFLREQLNPSKENSKPLENILKARENIGDSDNEHTFAIVLIAKIAEFVSLKDHFEKSFDANAFDKWIREDENINNLGSFKEIFLDCFTRHSKGEVLRRFISDLDLDKKRKDLRLATFCHENDFTPNSVSLDFSIGQKPFKGTFSHTTSSNFSYTLQGQATVLPQEDNSEEHYYDFTATKGILEKNLHAPIVRYGIIKNLLKVTGEESEDIYDKVKNYFKDKKTEISLVLAEMENFHKEVTKKERKTEPKKTRKKGIADNIYHNLFSAEACQELLNNYTKTPDVGSFDNILSYISYREFMRFKGSKSKKQDSFSLAVNQYYRPGPDVKDRKVLIDYDGQSMIIDNLTVTLNPEPSMEG